MKKSVLASLISVLFVSACGTAEMKKSIDDGHAKSEARTAEMLSEMKTRKKVPLVEDSNKPFISSESVQKVDRGSLPERFDDITMNFHGRQSLGTIAEMLHRVTGLSIQVNPDVFVNQNILVPGRPQQLVQGQSPSAVQGVVAPTSLPGASGMSLYPQVSQGNQSQTTGSTGDYFVDVPVNFHGSLKNFLDDVTTRLGIDWEYKDGKIELRRFVTRTFTLLTTSGTMDTGMSLGKKGSVTSGSTSSSTSGGSSSTSGSFDSTLSVEAKSKIDYLKSIEDSLRSLLSPMGKMSINPGTGTIVVIDTKDVMKSVSRVIDEENKMMTRQVMFEVRVLTLKSNDKNEAGVDWNMVLSKLSNLTPDWTLSTASPGSIVSSAAGTLALKLTKTPTNDSGLMGRLNGTSALVKSLAQVGKVDTVTSQRTYTLNRRSAPVAVINQKAYLASTTPAVSAVGSTGAATAPGLTPGMVNYGFIMNLTPTITDKNEMLLTFSMDLSDLVSLDSFISGTGSSQQTIQLPTLSSTQFMQNVSIKSGETLVVSGFEKVSGSYDQNTLGKDVAPGLGGSFSGSKTKESLIVLITPIVSGGN